MIRDPLHVAPDEREVVRVFALDMPPDRAAAFTSERATGPAPLQDALGATVLAGAHVESFAASDLTGIGLAGYLVEGLGIDAADIAPDRATLDNAGAHIVIVHSAAFGGTEQRLTPKPPLRHLGTYQQVQTEQRLVPLPGQPMEPGLPPDPKVGPAPIHPAPKARGLMALLAAAVIVLLIVYLLGGGNG